jgi:23S rRNA pseudouridine1911/1915/1917 synthase
MMDKMTMEVPTMELLWQDRQAVVCLKPAGVASQASSGANMPALLEAELGCPVWPVHRLDKPTAGVMVYAKSAAAAATLSRYIQEGTFAKRYLAVLTGCPEAPQGRLTDLLYHDPRRNKTYVVDRKRRGVREAALEYQVLAQQDGRALVWVRLLTGRTHQIRAQFAARGLPLVGDGPYGGGSGPLGLWCAGLSFPDGKGGVRSFRHQPPAEAPWDRFGPVTFPD